MSNCKTIAICNQKGGVGKTITSVNLGIGLVMQGKKVLLVDADPQGDLTTCLGWQDTDSLGITLATKLTDVMNETINDTMVGILHHDEGVDLVPANLEFSAMEYTDSDDVDMEICRKEDFSVIDEQSNIEKEQADLYVEESREMDDGDAEQIYTGKNVAVDDEVPVIPLAADKVEWIADRLSECGAYEDVGVPVKAEIFGFDIADVSGSIRLFSDVMKRMGIKLAGDELYEEFRRIYDESVSRDAEKEKIGDKMWNRGRGK